MGISYIVCGDKWELAVGQLSWWSRRKELILLTQFGFRGLMPHLNNGPRSQELRAVLGLIEPHMDTLTRLQLLSH